MKLKVKCINDVKSPVGHNMRLAHGKVYNICAFRKHSNNKLVNIKEIPEVNFLPRRFAIIGKIDITLPDDLDNINI